MKRTIQIVMLFAVLALTSAVQAQFRNGAFKSWAKITGDVEFTGTITFTIMVGDQITLADADTDTLKLNPAALYVIDYVDGATRLVAIDSTGAIIFGDGDSKIFERTDDAINIDPAGGVGLSNDWEFTGDLMGSRYNGRAAFVQTSSTGMGNITVVPAKEDLDTGLSGTGADELGLYAGNVQFIHLVEAGSDSIIFNDGSADIDFIIESDTRTHAFWVEGATGRISMGTSTVNGLVTLNNDNTVSNYAAFRINNAETSSGLELYQDGILDGSKYGLYLYSNAVQSGSELARIHQDHASSTADLLFIDNDGTGNPLYIQQDGVLAASHYGLYVYSNAVQTNSPLVYLHQDNASSDQAVLRVIQDGSAVAMSFGGSGSKQNHIQGARLVTSSSAAYFEVSGNSINGYGNAGSGGGINLGTVNNAFLYLRDNAATTGTVTIGEQHWATSHTDGVWLAVHGAAGTTPGTDTLAVFTNDGDATLDSAVVIDEAGGLYVNSGVMHLGSDAANTTAYLQLNSAGGAVNQIQTNNSDQMLFTNASGGYRFDFDIVNTYTTGVLDFSGATSATISATGAGQVTIASGDNFAISQGDNLYFDGGAGGNTYIDSPTADNLRIITGNVEFINFNEGATDILEINPANADLDVSMEPDGITSGSNEGAFYYDAGNGYMGFSAERTSGAPSVTWTDSSAHWSLVSGQPTLEFNPADGGGGGTITTDNSDNIIIAPAASGEFKITSANIVLNNGQGYAWDDEGEQIFGTSASSSITVQTQAVATLVFSGGNAGVLDFPATTSATISATGSAKVTIAADDTLQTDILKLETAKTVGQKTFTNSGATADTVATTGGTATSRYFVSWATDPGAPADWWVEAKADTLILHTGAAVTGTPSYNWMRIEE